VAYGIVGFKAHAKMLLVVRREGNALRRYVHLGTGNYHTARRAYTDFSLLTCDERIGEDVHRLFQQITGLGRVRPLRKLCNRRLRCTTLVELIDARRVARPAGTPARIVAKMNALSRAEGHRGPVPGLAGRRADRPHRPRDLLPAAGRARPLGDDHGALHHRALPRAQPHLLLPRRGAELVYCASADWMQRNFFRRTESAFPLDSTPLRNRVVGEGLTACLADTAQAWTLDAEGHWSRVDAGREKPVSAQQLLMQRLGGAPLPED
jgi:polyphosphate kinase